MHRHQDKWLLFFTLLLEIRPTHPQYQPLLTETFIDILTENDQTILV